MKSMQTVAFNRVQEVHEDMTEYAIAQLFCWRNTLFNAHYILRECAALTKLSWDNIVKLLSVTDD